MWQGKIRSIHIAESAGKPMLAVDSIRAVPGKGLEGDRYFKEVGFYSWYTGPIREVSLIEEEVLVALKRDHGIDLEPGLTRRNIVTCGVPLGHLVNCEFKVGNVLMRGVEICEPCQHLVEVTGMKVLLPALIHRGGLHAQILSEGVIQVGDAVDEVLV